MIIEISGIPVNIIKKNIKNMHLYVKPPDGHVEVSAPVTLSDESIKLFLRTKIGWIRTKQSEFDIQLRQSKRQFVSGESFYLWGKKYYLRVKYSNRGNSLILHGDEAILTVREGSTSKQRESWVNDWYREHLKEQIERLLPKWVKITGLEPTSWQIKYMTTRWGTCNTQTGKILFNLQLAKKPVECIEYIILHELAHLRVRNHGKEFIAIMDENMPYWREIRKKLNDSTLDYMKIGNSYADD